MTSDRGEKTEQLEYATRRGRLNIWQKLSIFVLRIAGVLSLLDAAQSVVDILYSRARGYVMSNTLFYPVAISIFAGSLALILARPLGGWLGSGLGNDDTV